ncbi:MAG: hypothetical protein HN559_07060 [Gemmatimonadetes bacterium]|nr:hypothetical protein [Gemmatimonadota bacterium]MBT5143362.1 hypothetical protein [Gemmatimonadota bacterium]MBT7594652.1 hypothetical protein [Gemmatimonadota bacterium]
MRQSEMSSPMATIVQRVFTEKTSTLLEESGAFTAEELAQLCMDLRQQMHQCLENLPESAFEPGEDRAEGEPEWTAGEIISHNSDRLLWAMEEAATTLGFDLPRMDASFELVKKHAARTPRLLGSVVALEVLEAATKYAMFVHPILIAADHGQETDRTHHGLMSLTAWLLLMCIHDGDHLDQLQARQ